MLPSSAVEGKARLSMPSTPQVSLMYILDYHKKAPHSQELFLLFMIDPASRLLERPRLQWTCIDATTIHVLTWYVSNSGCKR